MKKIIHLIQIVANHFYFGLLTIYFFFSVPCLLYGQGQPYLSENWSNERGEMTMLYKNSTTTDNYGNVYVAGATLNSSGSHDILIQKINPKGMLIWEQIFDGNANMDDMASDIFVDNHFNVYITGTSVENQANDLDLVVLKYDENGVLKWKYYYDGGSTLTPKDAGTAITGDNNGNVYVTGSSFNSSTLTDYVTIRLNTINGHHIWVNRYDYLGLNEIPVKVEVQNNNLFVSGASQIAVNKWELSTVRYHVNNGQELGVRRSVGNATDGINEIYDLTIDDQGYIYLTGAVKNQNTNFDIAIYKLDNQLNIIWERFYDETGGDDRGKGIKVDNQGNVYVAGYVSTSNEGKNLKLLKYDTNGQLVWKEEFNGLANQNDEAVQLVLDNNNHIYVLGTVYNSSISSFQTLMYNANGDLITQATFDHLIENLKPSNIAINLSGNVIVVGQVEMGNGNYKTTTIQYNFHTKPFDIVYENGIPSHNANELIIRFDKRVINYDAVNRRGFVAGQLDDFLNVSAVNQLNNKLKMDVSRLETFKIFRKMTTSDSLSITRLGDTIKVDDFWATLSVMIPNNNILNIIDSLKTLKEIIHYAEVNRIGVYNTVIPNDPKFRNFIPPYYYSINQGGLVGGLNAHGINLVTLEIVDGDLHLSENGGWGYEVGKSSVKTGVFDTGINWKHEDFGDGTWQSSVVKGGWDYGKGVHPSTQSNSDPITTSGKNGHGTAVAGIIGAIRNNGVGIAGIAGGDFSEGIDGVSLYSLRTSTAPDLVNEDTLLTIASASEAILEGASNSPTSNYGFGLNVHNYSWRLEGNHPAIDTMMYTLRNAVYFAFKNNVIQVASSGNTEGYPAFTADTNFYPASFNDDWILKVGANESYNYKTRRVPSSVYGKNVDILAPGTGPFVYTLMNNDLMGYRAFGGTSASAPHVSGVASLLLSKHNPLYDSFYTNILSNEDIEYLLKKSAIPVKFEGNQVVNSPNVYSGKGSLNALNALSIVSKPYKVRHFDYGVTYDTSQIYASNINIVFPEGIDNLPINATIGTTTIFKMTDTLSYSLPINELFLTGWIRNASCDLYGLVDTIYNSHWSGSSLDYINEHTAVISGYVYKTKITTPDTVFYKTFPEINDTTTLKMSFSVHTQDSSYHLGSQDVFMENDISIYPNPMNDLVNISCGNKLYQLTIYDISGRILKSVDLSKSNQSVETIDVSDFKSGVYLFVFDNEKQRITKKLIKN